jgi:hypothetical protein
MVAIAQLQHVQTELCGVDFILSAVVVASMLVAGGLEFSGGTV